MAETIFTTDNFEQEVLKSDVPVLVDFWAPWCGPCQILGPIVEEIAEKTDARKAKIGKLNVDENGQIAQQYNVMSIPTIIIFKDGEVQKQFVGVQDKEMLEKELTSLT